MQRATFKGDEVREIRPMIRWRKGLLSFLLILLVLSLAAVPVYADDDEGDDTQAGDTSDGDETDEFGFDDESDGEEEGEGEGEGEEEEEREPGSGGQSFANAPPVAGSFTGGAHPRYKLKYRKDDDVGTWNHDFAFGARVTPRVSFRASSNINIRENDALFRENRQENWNAALDVDVTDAIAMGVKFTRANQEDIRNSGRSNEVVTFREKETTTLTTGYHKKLFSAFDTNVGVSAGVERNEYSNVRSRGSTQGVNASVRFEPTESLSTSLSYNGGHSLLDSEQAGVETTNESSDHSFSGHLGYDWREHSVTFDMTKKTSSNEYPKDGKVESRDQDSETARVSADLALLKNLTTKLGFDYSSSGSFYSLEEAKDNELKERTVTASLAYLMGGTNYRAELKSNTKRNEYFSFQTGDVIHETFALTASRKFGQRVDASLKGRTSLISYQFDDIEANDQDRDFFEQEASLQLKYGPRPGLSTKLLLRIRENQTIYIRRSRTGDNKTTQTYSVQPSFTKSFGPNLSASQAYEISADYTFYTYDEDSNFLIRSYNVTTGLSWKPTEKIRLSFEHKYKGQDEGSYVEDDEGVERYGKGSERDEQTFSTTLRYTLFGIINLEASQSYSVTDRWTFKDGERQSSSRRFETKWAARASVDHEFEGGTKLKLMVGKKLRDATSILERQRDYWDISLEAEHTF